MVPNDGLCQFIPCDFLLPEIARMPCCHETGLKAR